MFKVLYILVFCISFSFANENVEILAEDEWPPYSNIDGSGIANSLLRTAYEEVNITSDFKILPFARIKEKLKAGVSILGISFGNVSVNRRKYLFGKKPLFSVSSHFYVLKDSSLLSLKNMNDLDSSIKVGIIVGYNYGDFIDLNKNNITLERVATHFQNFEKLRRKRVDMILLYDDIAAELIKKNKFEGLLKKVFKGESLDIYAAFSKKHKDSKYFMDKLDKGLSLIKKNKKYERIFKSCGDKNLMGAEVLCIKP